MKSWFLSLISAAYKHKELLNFGFKASVTQFEKLEECQGSNYSELFEKKN